MNYRKRGGCYSGITAGGGIYLELSGSTGGAVRQPVAAISKRPFSPSAVLKI